MSSTVTTVRVDVEHRTEWGNPIAIWEDVDPAQLQRIAGRIDRAGNLGRTYLVTVCRADDDLDGQYMSSLHDVDRFCADWSHALAELAEATA